MIEVRTQKELDNAIKTHPGELIACISSGSFEICDSSQVTAYGSSQVTACGSSQVTAYDSSQVTACDSSQVRACDSSQVTASEFVAVTNYSKLTKLDGGVLIELPTIKTAEQWCEFHGVEASDGVVTLFKAVSAEFKSGYGFDYAPGTTPEAPDWDGGEAECGGGLHFSPRPAKALQFMPEAKRFVACPVKLDDIAVHENAIYPDKVKAPRCCAPVWECDIDGNRLGSRITQLEADKKRLDTFLEIWYGVMSEDGQTPDTREEFDSNVERFRDRGGWTCPRCGCAVIGKHCPCEEEEQ